MFFEQDRLAFQFIDAFVFQQKNIKMQTAKRNFDALSFRIYADTVIEYGGKTVRFEDKTIGFFPAGISYTRTAKTDHVIVIHFKTLNKSFSDIECYAPSDAEKYQKLFEELLSVWQKKEAACHYKAASLLNLIFAELCKDNQKSYASSSKIYASVKYMEENHLNPEFSLSAAAQKSYVSETYFRKLFKAEFGVSPKQYVITQRIKHAASLIIAGYQTLEEIASLCGYRDYKHFSVEFKKSTGVSPSKYIYNYD